MHDPLILAFPSFNGNKRMSHISLNSELVYKADNSMAITVAPDTCPQSWRDTGVIVVDRSRGLLLSPHPGCVEM